MKRLLAWLLDRADEPSTWRGLFFIGSALGFLTLDPDKAAILAAGLAMVFGGADVIVPEPTRKLRKPAESDGVIDALQTIGSVDVSVRQDSTDRSAADVGRETWIGD